MSQTGERTPGADDPPHGGTDRRGFLGVTASVAMAGGLVGGYGAFAAVAGRYLYPVGGPKTAWQFVAVVAELAMGQALIFKTPAGEGVTIARQGEGDTVEHFIALSSTCPHLGCKVHWEPQNNRFFCPCHNGVFTPDGKAISGPPADAGQSLIRYPLKVENGLLFIEVAVEV